MVIQTRIHDGISVKTRTYRKIYKSQSYYEWREGFMAQSSFCKWGEMVQLRGTERILLASFGRVES